MYTREYYDAIKRQIRSMLIKIAIIFVIFLAIALTVAKNVDNTLGLIILILGVCIDQFIWGIYGRPVWTYRSFVREVMTGRERHKESFIVGISDEPVYKDNKLFYYEVFIKEDHQDEVEQLLLFDGNMDPSSLQYDNLYTFKLYQNYIVGVKDII